MKKTILFLAFIATTGSIFAQKIITTSGAVSFDATTEKDPLPKADNKTVIGSIDTQTGAVAFEAAVKNFSFTNPTMQQHFNGEKWLNSDKFPKITFTGQIENLSAVNFAKNGTYQATVNADLTIKDVTKKIKVEGTITVTGKKVKVGANFSVKLADFNISGVPVEAGKVSREPKITALNEFELK